MYFPGVARLSNIFPWKRISSFDFTRNLSLEAFNAFLNKSRFGRENVRVFCSSEMSFGMQKKAGDDGGWHERQLCTTKQPRTPSVTRGQYSKRRAVETPVIFFRPGCKFGRESHFVASFMPIICILSPPMQFPFSGSGSARETPNKISGQGLRSWKKLFRPMVTLSGKILHIKAWKLTVTKIGDKMH